MADQGQCVGTDSSGPEAAAAAAVAAEEPAAPPEVLGTRTRSGRRVRTPALLLADSQAPSPARRARKPALALLKEGSAEEKEKEEEEVVMEEEEGRTVATMRLGHGCNGAEVETAPGCPDRTPREKALFVAGAKQTPAVPLGKPKSGRVWKDRNKQRFSALVRDKPLKTSWGKKMEAKQEKQMVKKFSLQLKEDKAKVKEDKRKRQEETLKRRAENERKAEVVQVIRNTSKIKRMKKKQLRKVEKRDTLALLQKSQSGKAKGQRSSKEAKVDN